jgi:FkbM family methyltransferase
MAVFGSDIPRSRRQLWQRRVATIMAKMLNRPTPFATEIVQAINPVATIATKYGPLYCRVGHGRLLWRAETFFTEEPQTITWLDSLKSTDVLYDVGANVGLYAIYAAKFRKCQVFAFEPEAQNYALFMQNISLNELEGRCLPANLAIARSTAMGKLRVRYLTKGGAYNLFRTGNEPIAESVKATMNYAEGFDQLMLGVSLDDLVAKHKLPPPTHLKIDVDGIEPEIVAGAVKILPIVRSVLIELNAKSDADLYVIDRLASFGFKVTSSRSIWESKGDKAAAVQMPAYNMIFER